jgi:hypothetical protein
MATEKRTSEQGTVFGASSVRDFLLMALGHDAVIDRVNDLLFEHVMEGKYHPSVVAASLEPIIDEVLGVATFEDWDWAARALTADACEALGVEHPLNRTPEAQPPQTPTETRRSLRGLDPGELREKLAEIYTHDPVSPRAACRAWWITRRISQLTGISREQIKTEAKTDAEAIKATLDENRPSTDQSSAHPTPEVTIDAATPPLIAARIILRHQLENDGAVHIEETDGEEHEGWVLGLTRNKVTLQDPATSKITTIHLSRIENMVEIDVNPRVFVRPLTSEEADSLKFIQTGQHADDLAARTQAAILLGSNAGCTTSQIAAMLVVDESKVHKVIADFNERGINEIAVTRRAECEHVIETARSLDPQTFDIDTRLAQPGKYEGASDLQLVVALDIINGHGFADERTGEAAVSGYAWRVNRFVGIEDSQGFISAEEHPTARHAAARLREFDVPVDDEES